MESPSGSRFLKPVAQNIVSFVNYRYRRFNYNRQFEEPVDYQRWSQVATYLYRRLIRVAIENHLVPYSPSEWGLCHRETRQSLYGVWLANQEEWPWRVSLELTKLNASENRSEVDMWNISAYLVTTLINRGWSAKTKPRPNSWPKTWMALKRTVNVCAVDPHNPWEMTYRLIKRISFRRRRFGWDKSYDSITSKAFL